MTTWANGSKNSTTFANLSKSASTFANQAKTLIYSFLLMESSDALLMESGENLLLESAGSGDTWNNINKS